MSAVPAKRPAGNTDRWLALVTAVERLSAADSLEDIIQVVRETARAVSGADGVTFVLRDGSLCHYVEESAIGPLWKGNRFPMTACISGWCMLNKKTAAIPDIYVDARIPHDAYRPTFVKSLVMVPVRADDPLAAIGSYWSAYREFDEGEIALLEGLGRSTAAAIAAVQAKDALRENEERLRQAQAELMHVSRLNEVSQMSSAFAHELTQPLSAASNYLGTAQNFLKAQSASPQELLEIVDKANNQLARTNQIIQRIRSFIGKAQITRATEELLPLVEEAWEIAQTNPKHRNVDLQLDIDPALPSLFVDRVQIQQVLLNLFRNACEAMEGRPSPRIAVSAQSKAEGFVIVRVEDNGPGLSPEVAARLFLPFVTTKADGMGVGLSICRQIIEGHGGQMWADLDAKQGTAFCLTLPTADASEN